MFSEMQRILIRAGRYGYCKERILHVAHFTSEFLRLEYQTFLVRLESLSGFKRVLFVVISLCISMNKLCFPNFYPY